MIKMVIVDDFKNNNFSLGGSDDEHGDLLGGYSCNEDDCEQVFLCGPYKAGVCLAQCHCTNILPLSTRWGGE